MAKAGLRRGTNEIVIFGRHPVEAALRSEGAEVASAFGLRSRASADREALRRLCAARDVPYEEISRPAMDALTGAPRHDQGVAARVRLLRVMEIDALVAATKGRGARRPVRVVALDGVTNSQNVGMVVRSAVAAGIDGLLWPMKGQPWINGLVVRAAVGAIFECPIVVCDALAPGLSLLAGAGFASFGLDAGANRSLFELETPHRAVFVLGSESAGLSPEVAAAIDERLSIPMAGGVESLNVAVAAGLVCYHACGRLRSPRAAGGGSADG